MKKTSIAMGSMIATMLGGYGAWCIYKKMNPKSANEVKKDMKKMTRNMKKSIEDMM